MKTGVYVIANLVNGKLYVGSSAVSFAKRFSIHRHHLSNGTHHSRHLQAAWDKYGPDAFEFAPIEFTAPDDAVRVEQTYIDDWKPAYNVSPTAASTLGVKYTDVARESIRQARNKPEAKARLSASLKAANKRPEVKAVYAAANARPEVRERKRQASMAAGARPEVRAARAAASSAMWSDPVRRAQCAAAIKEAANRPDVKARRAALVADGLGLRIGASLKAALAKPEIKARMSARMAEVMMRPEVQARQRAVQLVAQQRPEVKAAKSEAAKAAWAGAGHKERMVAAYKEAWSDPGLRHRHGEILKAKQCAPDVVAARRARSKLTPAVLAEIYAAISNGETQASMAKRFGLDRSTVSLIQSGKHWSCVA